MGKEKRYTLFKLTAGRNEELKILGTRRSRWEDNTKMHLKELGYVIVNLFHGDRCQQL